MEYSIGDFAMITRFPIKTLHYYHECGLLVPSRIDPQTGYRYYNQHLYERAQAIAKLKQLGFSLNEIKDILNTYAEDSDLIDFLEDKKEELARKAAEYTRMLHDIERLIKGEKEMAKQNFTEELTIKNLEPVLIAGIRHKGDFKNFGSVLGKLFKTVGPYACGCPLTLYHSMDMTEEGWDMEICVPIRKEVSSKEIQCRWLDAGQALCLNHIGSYETISASYKKLMDHVEKNKLQILIPSREIYRKGPGMIFRGNPKNYITEIQFVIKTKQ